MLAFSWLGRRRYQEVWDLQEATRARLLADPDDDSAEHVFFVEHEPVITLGRSADPSHVLATPPGVEVVRTSRGGDVTVHGPGQLVVYPVLRLRAGVVAHVTTTGAAIVEALHALGLTRARFSRDPVGVFVDERKIAACGVHVSRRVAIHGWALNVSREVRALFDLVVPCGLAGVPVTTIEDELAPMTTSTTTTTPTTTSNERARVPHIEQLVEPIARSISCTRDRAR